ncbi:MAG: oligosaccharide flippase family protein, partial [Candidatus Kapaibacteriota bacterium]
MGSLLKNTILVGTSEIASKGIIALAMILLVRTLSPESYGLYSLSITLTYFFIGLIHSGFYTIGMREIAKYPHLSYKYVNNVTLLKSIFALGSYVVLVLIVLLLDKPNEAKITFLLSGLFLFLLIFHIDWLFRGLDRMEITSIGSILQGISILIFIYLFVKKPNDYQIAVIGYLLSWFIYILFENLFYIKKYDWIKPEFDKEFSKILIKASLPISISSLIVTIYANNNILILNLYKGDYETGIYSAMVRLMNILLLPNSILQIAFFPELSRSVLNGSLKLFQKKYLVVLFAIGFFAMFGMFGFSKELLLFVFGEKYLVGDVILKISL